MPYTVRGNSVVRADTGAVVKHHPNREKALAHLRALKANVQEGVLGSLLEGFSASAGPTVLAGRVRPGDRVRVQVTGAESMVGRVVRPSDSKPETHAIVAPEGGGPHVEAPVSRVSLDTPERRARQVARALEPGMGAIPAVKNGRVGYRVGAGGVVPGGGVRESALGSLLEAFAPVGPATPAETPAQSVARAKTEVTQAKASIADFNCVPWRAEALSRHGFVPFEALEVGDEILAYDCDSDVCAWTPVRAIHVYAEAPTVTLRNRRISLEATADHSWVIRSGKGPRLCATADLSGRAQVVMAAPAPGGDSPLTPDEAAILGWLFTDGSITSYYVGRYGPYLQAVITQAKPEGVAAVRALTAGLAREHSRWEDRDYSLAGHAVVTRLRRHDFQFAPSFTAALLAKAGIAGRAELPRLVSRLSIEARAAMLDAMLLAEGSPHGRGVRFYQRPGPVLDALLMLCALSGRATGTPQLDRRNGCARVHVRASRFLGSLRRGKVSEQPVWCPTTDLGTWVMRLDGQVVVTGNSKHPRTPTGKFTTKGSTSTSSKRGTRSTTGGPRILSTGAKGTLVRAIQRQLHLPATGTYDKRTEEAIVRYQRQHGLLVDGKVGAQTIASLRGNPNARSVKPGPIPTSVSRVANPTSSKPKKPPAPPAQPTPPRMGGGVIV